MFVALLLATGAALAPPYLAGLAIDDGIKNGDMKALIIIVLAFLAAALINWAATYAQTFLINWVGQRALQDLRIELFQHLQKLSIGFYSRNKAGVLISRITNDVQALDQLVTEGISTLFSATLTLFGTAVILVLLDPLARAGHVPTLPGAARGQRRVPARVRRRVRAHAREDRAGHGVPAGDALGRARGARVRPGGTATRCASRS